MSHMIKIWMEIQNHHKSETFDIDHAKPIPRVGESIALKGEKYRIIDITHDYGSALPKNIEEPVIRMEVVTLADEVTREIEG